MRRREPLICAVLALAALPPGAAARPLRHEPLAKERPRAFASCTDLIGYARRHFSVTHGLPEPPVTPLSEPVVAYGPQGAAAPVPTASTPSTGGSATGTASSPSFSTTNNQEVGVDEPDIVKTNGSTIFTVAQNKLYAVVAGGSTPAIVGSLDLGSSGYGAELLLRGNRLIVISSGGPVAVPLGAGSRPVGGPLSSIYPSPYYYGGQTVIREVDVQHPAAMRVTRTMTVDGHFVDARQNGASARLVISSPPAALATPALSARASGWVPTRRFHSMLSGRRYVRAVAACGAVRRPAQFSGLGMLTILTIDLDRGLYATDSQALMADAQVVYGSQSSLYVATQKWIDPQTPPAQVPATTATVIDRFDVTDPSHTTLASGEVPGYLLNQYSLSEFKGYLRVATTSRPIWWGSQTPASSQSYVTVLASQGGQLVPVGRVSGLGAGQQIYSVRFVDDTGYVVTFHHVDPLYAIDLSSPTAPRVAGQLELQGYSAYLHPVGKGLLLGVGQDVGTTVNEPSGVQLELFDVSNAGAPKLLARTTLGEGSSSEVQYDPHAFLFWAPTQLAVLPVQIYPAVQSVPPVAPAPGASATTNAPSPSGTQPSAQGQQFTGAIGFHVSSAGIVEAGRVSHDAVNGYTPPVRRSVVIGDTLYGDTLYTVSDGGVMASSLATLAREGFAAFPTPPLNAVGTGSAGPPTPAATGH